MVRGFLTDRFYVYGDRGSFESAQLPTGKPILFESESGPLGPGQRGRRVTQHEIDIPDLSEYVEGEFKTYVRELNCKRGILVAHEFIRSIAEGRQPEVDANRAANWTAASLCAHESAMQKGEKVAVPQI